MPGGPKGPVAKKIILRASARERKEEKEMRLGFDEFANEVVEKVQEFLPESFGQAEISLQVVCKNNDVRLTGLTIKSSEKNVAPTIYLDGLYENYEGGEEIEAIARKIVTTSLANMPESVDVGWITDYEQCRGKVLPRLVSAEMNCEGLAKKPHRIMEDLAITYNVFLDNFEGGQASVQVTNEMLEKWGVDEEELHERAIENLAVLMPGELKGMTEVMLEMLPGADGVTAEDVERMMGEDEKMFVLTNVAKTFGATAILDEKLMKEVAERIGEDFYVLPSSVHELLLVKGNGSDETEALKSMVAEVNDSQVDPQDRLSYSVYRYAPGRGLVKA